MKVFFLRLISIGIITGILFLNLRTLYAFLQAKKARGNTVSILQTITGGEDRAVLESPPIEPIKKHKQNCRPSIEQKELTNTSKKIILRLDDVGAGTPVGIFKKFVVDTNRYHAPLVLGIIPEGLETNTELTTFLESESCNLEFAIHGLDHFSAQSTTGNIRFISEFSEISFGDALTRLQKAKEILSSHTDEPIITFIPPYNLISEEGVLAVKQIGLKVISSIGTGAFDAQLGENRHEARSVFSKSKVLEGCKYSLDNEGICIVLLHLNDFLKEGKNELDETIYYEYLGLLEDFSKNGDEFTTFRKLQMTWPDFFQYSLTK